MSRVGPQQGDSLAGLLFCLAIQKLLRATRSAFTSGYMDDIALGGNARDVTRDVEYIRTEGEAIGLSLTMKNARSFQDLITQLLPKQPSFKIAILMPEDSTSLDAPLSRGSALESCLGD